MENYDLFVSHCSKDKLKYVDGLVTEIKKAGIKVFYDSESISWGDDIKATIDKALDSCTLALVVISKSFFDRTWTEYELSKLLSKQNELKEKLILPLLYKITKQQLIEKYPDLKNIKFIHAKAVSKKKIAEKLKIELDKKNAQKM